VISLIAALAVVGMGAFLYRRYRHVLPAPKPALEKKVMPSSGVARVHFKHGPYAGRSFELNKLPFLIGRDPANDLCLNDPHILAQHARIFETSNGYYLMDLGGETYVNGQMVKRNSAFLKPGDVVRLGKSALFVFGS
jgi:pSer/pThr/pTyr-binding forkhead associated (FHA) protein